MSFYTHDNTVDSPLNNFATFTPLAYRKGYSHVNLSNGNLRVQMPNSTIGFTNFTMSGGKWYWEVYIENNGTTANGDYRGVLEPSQAQATSISTNPGFIYNSYNGNLKINGSWTSSDIGTANNPDIIGFFWNADDGEMTVSVNSVAGTTITGLTTGIPMCPFSACNYNTVDIFNFGQDHTFGGNKTGGGAYTDANGIGQFYYEPPEGALSLCTANIPEGPIKISEDDVPADYFKAVTYNGNGGTQSIDVGFQPDLVWGKSRIGNIHNCLFDSVRGAGSGRCLTSNITDGETSRGQVDSFDSNGFSVSGYHLNNSSFSIVAWCWKAAGTPADNQARIIDTDGSLITKSTADLKTETGASITPSKVSANRKSGFSILKYTGSGSAGATVPHGLSQPPELVITKNLDGTDSWLVSTQLVNDLFLNKAYQADAYNRVSGYSSSTISINNSTAHNGNNINYISYFWHSVAGYSKFGSYVGNGSADGPFIECGFRPAWVMVKNADRSDAHWLVYDNQRSEHNVINKILFPSSSAKENGEGTLNRDNVDFLSNGFKMKGDPAGGWSNHSGHNIIFAAFAEAPFNAPATAR